MTKNMPIFVRVEKYDDISKTIAKIKEKMKEAKTSLDKIMDLRTQEEKEIEEWSAELESVEERIATIEDTLMHPEEV